MSAELLVTLDNVSAGYGRHVVLGGVSLQLRRGSFTALLGGNGSGKSTLLKTIVGILPPLASRVIYHLQNGRKPIVGYVPQRETLDPLFLVTSFDVVLMGSYGRLRPGQFISRAEKEWARQCLAETGAADLQRTQFSQLSGGQKQRVLIARARATKPDFLVLDEPTAGIDVAASQAIMALLRQIHARQRMTILLVTHDLLSVRETVEDVIWLRGGTLTHGPAAQLLTREKIGEIFNLELF